MRLGSHKISSTHRPTVDLLVDDFSVHTFEFTLTVDVDVDLLVAVVRGGHLVAARCGGATVTADLVVDGFELARRRHRVDLELLVDLRQGIAIA